MGRIPVFTIISIVFSAQNLFALTQFPKGSCEIEGKVVLRDNTLMLSVNYGSEAESLISLAKATGLPSDFSKHRGDNALFALKFDKVQLSAKVSAVEAKFVKFTGDELYPTVYDSPLDFKCSEMSLK